MNILKHTYEDVSEGERKILEKFFKGYDYQGSGYTFIANYIWRNSYHISYEIINDYLFIAGTDQAEEEFGESPYVIISMPLTETGRYDDEKFSEAILEVKSRFDKLNIPFTIELIPEHMIKYLEEAFPNQMEFVDNRDEAEYVYLKEKLITLSGRALHKKKNHLNFFLKNYEYESKPVDATMAEEIMAFVDSILENKSVDDEEYESLIIEREAIEEMLKFVHEKDVYSRAIYIGGKLQAFSLGERLSKDRAVAHFEKANDDYRGLYQVIAMEFCKSLPEEIKYVNREEDMGLPGLRHAKESLKPDHLTHKYTGTFKKIS